MAAHDPVRGAGAGHRQRSVLSATRQPAPDLAEGRTPARRPRSRRSTRFPTRRSASPTTARRRRFSREWQDEVLRTLKEGIGPKFVGTSNVQFALEHGLTPLGTMAHEYLQACQAVGPRLRDSQVFAFNTWAREYRGDLGIALSDICGMDAFLRDFDLFFCKLFDGVRHDSGDPFEWGEKMIAHYQKMRIDPRSKVMVFSDRLNVAAGDPAVRIFQGSQPDGVRHRHQPDQRPRLRCAADRDQDDALQWPAGRQDQRRAIEGDGLRSVVRRLSARGVRGAGAGGNSRRRRARRRLTRLPRRARPGTRRARPRRRRRTRSSAAHRAGRRLAPSRLRSATAFASGYPYAPQLIAGNAIDASPCADGELQRTPVARGQQLRLAGVAAMPHRADRVDDVARRQAIATRDLGIAGGAAAEGPAFGEQFGSGRAMDRAIDAAAAQEHVLAALTIASTASVVISARTAVISRCMASFSHSARPAAGRSRRRRPARACCRAPALRFIVARCLRPPRSIRPRRRRAPLPASRRRGRPTGA